MQWKRRSAIRNVCSRCTFHYRTLCKDHWRGTANAQWFVALPKRVRVLDKAEIHLENNKRQPTSQQLLRIQQSATIFENLHKAMASGQKLYPRATVKKIVKAHSKKNVTKNVDVMIFLDYALFLQTLIREAGINAKQSGERTISTKSIKKVTEMSLNKFKGWRSIQKPQDHSVDYETVSSTVHFRQRNMTIVRRDYKELCADLRFSTLLGKTSGHTLVNLCWKA